MVSSHLKTFIAICLILNQSLSEGLALNRTVLLQWYPRLQYMRTIKLVGWKIDSIEADSFAKLPFVKRIFLDKNQLSAVDANLFKDLTNLQTISLSIFSLK